jgi:carboxypeptidase C (cathepsin A)
VAILVSHLLSVLLTICVLDAGHYIPAIGEQIHNANKGKFDAASYSLMSQRETLADVNLKSLMIGNGLTDPLTQYKYYAKVTIGPSYNAEIHIIDRISL